jgi:rhodanese-related sulfurtransferase
LESLKRLVQGVLVCEVLVGVDGRMRQVEVLQAPDERMGAAAKDALLKSVFGRIVIDPATGRNAQMHAKLFWYFVIDGGRGLVLTPEELATHRGLGSPKAAAVEVRVPTIGLAEWRRRSLRPTALLLDIQTRESFLDGHLPEAVNIPEDELWARTTELQRSLRVVIDCPQPLATRCSTAVRELSRAGFADVAVLRRN